MQAPETLLQDRATAGPANEGARSVQASSSRVKASKALFVTAAGVSFLFSVYLWFLVDREQGLFVGLWVPSILALGALLLPGRGGER